jgi:integrase
MAQAAMHEWRKQAKYTGANFMFAIRTNSPIDLHTAMARHLKPAARRAGVPVVSWHYLRLTYRTWGRLSGIKPETMPDQLGRGSVLMILMILGVYSHALDRRAEAAMIERFACPGGAQLAEGRILEPLSNSNGARHSFNQLTHALELSPGATIGVSCWF